jgi:putative transposase
VVDEIRHATNGNYALGDGRFVAEVEAMLGRRVTRGKPGRPYKSQAVAASDDLFI